MSSGATATHLAPETLLDFIPRVTPKYQRPDHLKPLANILEHAVSRARGKDNLTAQYTCSVPPRHGKTETILTAIAWGLARRPHLVFGYLSYSQNIAYSKSRRAQDLAVKAGVRLRSRGIAEWRTPQGGGMLADGILSPFMGKGVDVLIVDDPIKNRLEAESSVYRNRVWDLFTDASGRVEPGGTILVNMTRWHPDDLVGRLHKEEPGRWKSLRLPALSDDDETALWPSRWPADLLKQRRERVGPYTWASLYQGLPRPRGGNLFSEPRTYTELPEGLSNGAGADFAYTAKTSSDFSVGIHMAERGGTFYILDVIRRQKRLPEFKSELNAWLAARGVRRIRWYGAGVERGVADLLAADKAEPIEGLEFIPATADKFIRAQPVAAAWNAGKVLVPASAPEWLDDFLSEICSVTGVDDEHDDQLDALAAAYDMLAECMVPIEPERTPEDCILEDLQAAIRREQPNDFAPEWGDQTPQWEN